MQAYSNFEGKLFNAMPFEKEILTYQQLEDVNALLGAVIRPSQMDIFHGMVLFQSLA